MRRIKAKLGREFSLTKLRKTKKKAPCSKKYIKQLRVREVGGHCKQRKGSLLGVGALREEGKKDGEPEERKSTLKSTKQKQQKERENRVSDCVSSREKCTAHASVLPLQPVVG